MKPQKGFVLPIVMLLLTFMALLWSYSATPAHIGTGEEVSYQRYQDEIIFWQKAVLAYSVEYDRVPLSAHVLAHTYDLELPIASSSGGERDLSVNGLGLFGKEFSLEIAELPTEVLAKFSDDYAPYMSVDSFKRLRIPVMAIDSWWFSRDFLPRLTSYGDGFENDLGLSQQRILEVSRVLGNVIVDELVLARTGTITEMVVGSSQSERLTAAEAYVAGEDLVGVFARFEELEQAIKACLAPAGSC